MRFVLPEIVNTEYIYNDLLYDLSEYYSRKVKNIVPTVSFIKTESIEANAIPIIMCIFNIMSDYHQKPIQLEIIYKPRLLYFLDRIDFFYYAKKLKFISYNEDYIGGFSDYINAEYNSQHKLHVYFPVVDYEYYDDNKKTSIRDSLYEKLVYHDLRVDFNVIMQGLVSNFKFNDKGIQEFLEIMGELVENSQIHSKSCCYCFVQTGIKCIKNKKNMKKMVISVADNGVGFKESLNSKKKSKEYSYELQKVFAINKEDLIKNIDSKIALKLDDYFSIMEVLFYSEHKPRKDLYDLKKLIVNNNGDFKLHFKGTQVTFPYSLCKNCQKDILQCINCHLKRYKSNFNTIKIYNNKLSGVHIDVEFYREVNQ